ncbi:thiopurine S-methyltransferase [Elysia marginata]|uniref:thiopurine S-methyltransferase n=1 Tax=Elysia marginata TaxID=1093978 RepID=A0AAV4EV11_9GAST|nr:thiopurine S-methyltransferase [Elysia marginata]
MASESTPTPDHGQESCDRVKTWEAMWEQGYTPFHVPNVNKMLQKYISKLNPDGNLKKIFVPLCGKSVDMKWLADQGFVTVGVEGVQQALDQFFLENGLDKTETNVTGMGPAGKLIQSKDGMIKLYCGDMMLFSTAFEGTFDAIWDRGSLVALNREDVPGYVKILKDLMHKSTHILVEVLQYDLQVMADLDESQRPPPPHSMSGHQMKELFEPQCNVEEIDRYASKILGGKDINFVYYLITKT